MRLLVLIAVLALAACETTERTATRTDPETPAAESTGNETQVSDDEVVVPEDFDQLAWMREALNLSDGELEALRESALDRGGFDLYRYAIALNARGEVDGLLALLDDLPPDSDEDDFLVVAAVALESWPTHPRLLLEIGERAHAAGMDDTVLMLADWASDPDFPLDPYDRHRIGEMLASIEHVDDFEVGVNLGLMVLHGNEALGLAADPQKGAELLEMAATAGNANQALEVGRMFFHGQGVPVDLHRAQDIYTHAGDKGNEFGYNNAAWILAVCPGFTAGERMVAMERIERGITEHGATSTRVDTLAAVHARLGNHHEAALAQQRALELFEAEGRDPADFPDMERRLGLYRQGRAYNEPSCHTRPGT